MKDKELFQQQLHDELLPGVRLMALIVIIGFASCVPLDYLIYSERLWDLLRVRVVVIGAGCLVMGLSFLPWTKNRGFLRWMGYFNVINCGFGLAWLTYAAGGSTCPYWTVILTVFFGGVLLQRFSILEAILICSSIIVFYCGLLLWSGEPILTVSFLVSNVSMTIGMAVAVIAAGYLRTLQCKEFTIRNSLVQAGTEHQKIMEELSRSVWVKDHSNEIVKSLQGLGSLPEFARQLMSRLTPLLGAQVGVFYCFDSKEQCYALLGSHGFKQRKGFKPGFKLGEGLIGQCALERAPIMLSEVPPDYMQISSGLGQAAARFLLAAPMILPSGIIPAVIEIGTLRRLGPREQALIDEVLPLVALNMDILESNQRTRDLLKASQQQQLELAAHGERMRASEAQLRQQIERLLLQRCVMDQTNAEILARSTVVVAAKQEAQNRTQARSVSAAVTSTSDEVGLPATVAPPLITLYTLKEPLDQLLVLIEDGDSDAVDHFATLRAAMESAMGAAAVAPIAAALDSYDFDQAMLALRAVLTASGKGV